MTFKVRINNKIKLQTYSRDPRQNLFDEIFKVFEQFMDREQQQLQSQQQQLPQQC